MPSARTVKAIGDLVVFGHGEEITYPPAPFPKGKGETSVYVANGSLTIIARVAGKTKHGSSNEQDEPCACRILVSRQGIEPLPLNISLGDRTEFRISPGLSNNPHKGLRPSPVLFSAL